jgi:hypothetical protein
MSSRRRPPLPWSSHPPWTHYVGESVADKPLLAENLPGSIEAKDFIRTICNETCAIKRSDVTKTCYKLMLPYATPINDIHNRASLAISTVMMSKLADPS